MPRSAAWYRCVTFPPSASAMRDDDVDPLDEQCHLSVAPARNKIRERRLASGVGAPRELRQTGAADEDSARFRVVLGGETGRGEGATSRVSRGGLADLAHEAHRD